MASLGKWKELETRALKHQNTKGNSGYDNWEDLATASEYMRDGNIKGLKRLLHVTSVEQDVLPYVDKKYWKQLGYEKMKYDFRPIKEGYKKMKTLKEFTQEIDEKTGTTYRFENPQVRNKTITINAKNEGEARQKLAIMLRNYEKSGKHIVKVGWKITGDF